MGRRTLLLIASILVAAVGTALIFLYVRGADDRAKGDATLVYVIVAKKDIAMGLTGQKALSAGSFAVVKYPSGLRPANALSAQNDSDLGSLNAYLSSTIRGPITPKTLITSDLFVAADEATSGGLAKGQFAVSIQLSTPDRVAGLIKPGSLVAVTVTLDNGKPLAFYLMKDIKVLSVGSNGQAAAVPGGVGEPVDNNVIALAVSAQQALNLQASEQGGAQLRLALEGPGSGDDIDATTKIDVLAYS